uniref:Uncharacterized protein n=1 Tax=Musa acuminata subsp. malaccensis TaxID=214687 RepID=A0A804KA04_MUSAM
MYRALLGTIRYGGTEKIIKINFSLIVIALSSFSLSFLSSPWLRPLTSRRWGEERRH